MTSPLIDMLLRELRISERELDRLIATAPVRYKVYNIPKRTGGLREIAHPAFELKIAQRALVREYLSKLPVHPSATAYKPGSSIRLNAEAHMHNRPILKYDFKDFFPSITEQAWLSYCERHGVMDRIDALAAGRLLFRRVKGARILRLSIGSPSSPILSNILMNEFDDRIFKEVSRHKITYTRYADDLTFSAERTWNLRAVGPILRSALNQIRSPKLRINDAKTVLATPKYHRQVTGLVLTVDQRVSLGRTRKRNIRAAIHHFITGKLATSEAMKLAGLLAFAKDVEPEFYTRMERVYGRESIERLKQLMKEYSRAPSS